MTRLVLAVAACVGAAGCGPPEPDVSAAELHRRYQDPAAGDAEYGGRTLAVGGTVGSVGYSWPTAQGSVTVVLGWEGAGPGAGVACDFPPEAAHQAAGLKEGDAVIIRGVCRGWALPGLPRLTGCALAR